MRGYGVPASESIQARAGAMSIFNPVFTSVKVTPCFEDNKH